MYHYTDCGLLNVYLRNGYTIKETKYGEAVAIHNLENLHQVLGMELVNNTPYLSGKEMKFLRKELDLSQKRLGEILGVSEMSIRNWESDRDNNISKPSERLLRILYQEHVNGDGSVRSLIDRINEIDRQIYKYKLELEETDEGWDMVA